MSLTYGCHELIAQAVPLRDGILPGEEALSQDLPLPAPHTLLDHLVLEPAGTTGTKLWQNMS